MFSFSQLDIPLIQAPMAGGANTPEMVSAVINLGGVGSYGFAYSQAEKITEDISTAKTYIHQDANGALNCNFFIFQPPEEPEEYLILQAIGTLEHIASDLHCSLELPKPPYFPSLKQQLKPIWTHRPDILTFHLGVPEVDIIDQAHRMDIAVGITATNCEEAQSIEAAGADFIVAQGIEAGGHRGMFSVNQHDDALTTHELVKTIKQQVSLPLVAAGGIMMDTDVKDLLSAGATAVQMGSAFLSTVESGTSDIHKNFLLNQGNRKTAVTTGFSGRPARGILNTFIERIGEQTVLPFPIQNQLTTPLRTAAQKNENGEYMSLWAGERFQECCDETVAQLIHRVFNKL